MLTTATAEAQASIARRPPFCPHPSFLPRPPPLRTRDVSFLPFGSGSIGQEEEEEKDD